MEQPRPTMRHPLQLISEASMRQPEPAIPGAAMRQDGQLGQPVFQTAQQINQPGYVGTPILTWENFLHFMQAIPGVDLCLEFWGKNHENPATFVTNLENYFFSFNVPIAHRTATAATY